MGNTPNIRFKGFTDDWEQRKLEDYIVEYREVTTENNQYPALTSSRKGIFLQSEYFAGNQIASEDNKGYNIVPYGYFTYRHMSDDEIFHFNINDIVENGIVSTLYPVFTTTDELDSRYLQYQLNHGHEFARFAVLQKQGGSRTYMYLSKLKQLSLTIPKSVEEQKNISGFFMELDHLITLHQRKRDETKKLKKFMLQKMFPKKDAKKPEIRFAGFTDDWEQRKVLDLLELLTDYDANGSFADIAKNVNTTDGDGYAWYVRITDLENQKPLSELKYVDESSYNFLRKTELHGGELLMAKRGDIGKVYIFKPRTKYATVAPNMYLLKLNDKVISRFLYDYFVSDEGNKKLTRLNASSTMGALYKDDVKNIDVIMPTIEEQAKIGNYFQALDHLITLHRRAYYNKKGGLTNVHNDNQQHYAIL